MQKQENKADTGLRTITFHNNGLVTVEMTAAEWEKFGQAHAELVRIKTENARLRQHLAAALCKKSEM